MIDFSNILINKNLLVKDALKQLDKTGEKILFVVDENNRLIGSVTDGDIRRWILNDGSLTSKIENACYKNTFYVYTGYNLENLKMDMLNKKITHVPVVDKNKKIIEIIKWSNVFEGRIIREIGEKLDVEVVVMAGGKGTRLDPFTRILPKPLVPIGDKSILEIIFEKFIEYGVNEFYLSVNYKANLIKSYFEEIQPNYKIKYLNEEKPLGTIGALKQLEGKISKPILLTNCDIIINTDYLDILKHHKNNKNDITMVASIKHYNIPYGVCKISNGGKLVELNEKPEYDLLINTGMYVLNPGVLKYIPEGQLFHVTDLIEKLKSTHNIGIYPISENSWIDIGEWVEYKKTVERLGL